MPVVSVRFILAMAVKEAGLRAFIEKLSMDTSSRPSYVEHCTQASLDSAASFVEKPWVTTTQRWLPNGNLPRNLYHLNRLAINFDWKAL